MHEKRKLSIALKEMPPTEWGAAALSELASEEVVFEGRTEASATNTTADLLRIYCARLGHCQEQEIRALGMQELIDALTRLAPGTSVEVQPFLGPSSSVTAFWDSEVGQLVGCITILGRDKEGGRQAFDIAVGKH